MYRQEREQLSNLAVGHVSILFKNNPLGAFYQDSVKHKLGLLLQAVDRAALAVNKPVLFSEIVPGFDLVVLSNPDKTQSRSAETDEFDSRAMSSVDESCLLLLSEALEQHMKERAAAGEEEHGAFIFQGGDGLHYFGFKTSDRLAVLREMGVAEDGLVSIFPGSEVLQ